MNNAVRVFYLLTCLFYAVTVGANEIPTGNWQGVIEMHNDIERQVKFKVKESSSEQYTIKMYYEERPYIFDKLHIHADRMTFDLDTGSVYSCELERNSIDHFSGECVIEIEEETRIIRLNMQAPPAPETDDPPTISENVDDITTDT